MQTRRVIVRFRAGPTWDGGSIREQPDWDAHADFIDALVEDGTIIMGGPYADNSGSLLLLEGVNSAEARTLLGADPFMRNGVFVLEEVREWTVFVDSLTQRSLDSST